MKVNNRHHVYLYVHLITVPKIFKDEKHILSRTYRKLGQCGRNLTKTTFSFIANVITGIVEWVICPSWINNNGHSFTYHFKFFKPFDKCLWVLSILCQLKNIFSLFFCKSFAVNLFLFNLNLRVDSLTPYSLATVLILLSNTCVVRCNKLWTQW